MKLHHGVVIDKIKQTSRAADKTRGYPVGLKLLKPVCDYSCLHQIHYTIGKHFRMNTQITFEMHN